MKKLILTFSFLVLLFGTLQASVSIIPMPQKCIEKRGKMKRLELISSWFILTMKK